MRAHVQQALQAVLLVEEHPVRNLLYSRYIAASGFSLFSLTNQSKSGMQRSYAVAVVSIPDNAAVHGHYRAMIDALPSEVPCVALSSGVLPSLFTGCAQLVRHINRADTHPSELVVTLKSIISK